MGGNELSPHTPLQWPGSAAEVERVFHKVASPLDPSLVTAISLDEKSPTMNQTIDAVERKVRDSISVEAKPLQGVWPLAALGVLREGQLRAASRGGAEGHAPWSPPGGGTIGG